MLRDISDTDPEKYKKNIYVRLLLSANRYDFYELQEDIGNLIHRGEIDKMEETFITNRDRDIYFQDRGFNILLDLGLYNDISFIIKQYTKIYLHDEVYAYLRNTYNNYGYGEPTGIDPRCGVTVKNDNQLYLITGYICGHIEKTLSDYYKKDYQIKKALCSEIIYIG